MRKEIKYISDCGNFIIENGKLKMFTSTDLRSLRDFLTEYLNVVEALQNKGKVFIFNIC